MNNSNYLLFQQIVSARKVKAIRSCSIAIAARMLARQYKNHLRTLKVHRNGPLADPQTAVPMFYKHTILLINVIRFQKRQFSLSHGQTNLNKTRKF